MTIDPSGWSKKLCFALLVVACATALAWRGTLDAGEWKELVVWVGGIYLGAQGLADASERFGGAKP